MALFHCILICGIKFTEGLRPCLYPIGNTDIPYREVLLEPSVGWGYDIPRAFSGLFVCPVGSVWGLARVLTVSSLVKLSGMLIRVRASHGRCLSSWTAYRKALLSLLLPGFLLALWAALLQKLPTSAAVPCSAREGQRRGKSNVVCLAAFVTTVPHRKFHPLEIQLLKLLIPSHLCCSRCSHFKTAWNWGWVNF